MATQAENNYEIYRQKAKELAEKRHESFSQSIMFYKSGNKALAKKLSKEGKLYEKQMSKANKKAAELIFTKYNKQQNEDTIDLHGLSVNEAIGKLKERISTAKQNEVKRLIVVVGKGNNNQNGPRIKPAVNSFAIENQLPVTPDFPNHGCIRIELSLVSSELPNRQTTYKHQSSVQKRSSRLATKNSKPPKPKAKSLKQLMYKANKSTAEKIFKQKNEGCSEREIDLTGLSLHEAIDRLDHRVALVKKKSLSSLIVISGEVKSAVEKYAQEHNINFSLNIPKPGCVLLRFKTAPQNIKKQNLIAPSQNRSAVRVESDRPNETSIEMPTVSEHPNVSALGLLKWIYDIVYNRSFLW